MVDKIIEIVVCSRCNKHLAEGAIICEGCGKTNPKLIYKQFMQSS
jgi:ribosomal protein L40E